MDFRRYGLSRALKAHLGQTHSNLQSQNGTRQSASVDALEEAISIRIRKMNSDQLHIGQRVHYVPQVGEPEKCKHDIWRTARTYPPDPRTLIVRRMEWCGTCGELLDDREWKIPEP